MYYISRNTFYLRSENWEKKYRFSISTEIEVSR
jgi:hypothetical protein